MVAANNGLIGMSKEHLGIALALNVPVMVVVTKIDICPPQILQQTLTQLTKILKSPGARKIPIFIKNREDAVNTAAEFVSQRVCPIFQVSNVTGESLDLVREFLNILPHHGKYEIDAPFEFHVNDTFSVPFVGTVVSGVVKSGVIHTGDTVLVGPDSLGQFTTTTIRSIERKRISVPGCSAGQSASFARTSEQAIERPSLSASCRGRSSWLSETGSCSVRAELRVSVLLRRLAMIITSL
jgi:GTPase